MLSSAAIYNLSWESLSSHYDYGRKHMADLLSIASGIAGFGPAMALMFYTLRDYTYPAVEKPFFNDKKIFAFFALGIVIGMLLFAFESWGQTISSTKTLLALIVGFAVMEELLKLVVLNYPKFQRKVDTAFYGLSFGLGISATFTFATIYASALSLETVKAEDMVAFSLLGVQLVLLHGSTTALIGIGVARGNVKAYFVGGAPVPPRVQCPDDTVLHVRDRDAPVQPDRAGRGVGGGHICIRQGPQDLAACAGLGREASLEEGRAGQTDLNLPFAVS